MDVCKREKWDREKWEREERENNTNMPPFPSRVPAASVLCIESWGSRASPPSLACSARWAASNAKKQYSNTAYVIATNHKCLHLLLMLHLLRSTLFLRLFPQVFVEAVQPRSHVFSEHRFESAVVRSGEAGVLAIKFSSAFVLWCVMWMEEREEWMECEYEKVREC